jgi:toxin-antitoxin system
MQQICLIRVGIKPQRWYNEIEKTRRLQPMKELGERLRGLRESVKLSQVKMAELLGVKQSSINRYEQGQSAPSLETLVKYADYFDVSLDYLLARTDNPQGKLYEHRPKIEPGSEEMKQFIEMCFDPQSPLNEKLKQMLLEMMEVERK